MPCSVYSDPKSLYFSDSFETALTVLANGLANDVNLNLVLGEIGIGKTTFIKYFLKSIQEDCPCSLVTNVVSSTQELYQSTLTGFGQAVNKSGTEEMGQQLRGFLKNSYAKHHQPSLLLIDDADTLLPEVLKGLNILSDMISNSCPLVQIILAGRESLLESLKTPELGELAKKIGTLCYLEPLTDTETKSYIHHRSTITGSLKKKLFDDPACIAIYRSSGGIPSQINELCDNYLVHAATQKKHQIEADRPPKVTEKSRPQALHANTSSWHPKLGKATVVLGGILVAAIAAVLLTQNRSFSPPENPPSVHSEFVVENENTSGEEKLMGRRPNNQISAAIALEFETFENPVAPANSGDKTSKNNTTKPGVSEEKMQEWQAIIETQNAAEAAKTISQYQQNVMPEADVSTEDQKLELLIALAEEQMAASKFSLPQNDNAYETYTRILSTSPDEKRALAGLQDIAGRYLEWAQKQRGNGNLKQSKILITRGLRVDSRNPELLSLKEEVTSELNSQSTDINLERPTKRKQEQVVLANTDRLRGDDTLEKSQRISATGKQNQTTIHRAQKPPLLKLQLENALEKQDYRTALGLADQILATAQNGATDSHWRETIVAATDAKQVIRVRIKGLLNQADDQFAAQQFSRPAGENAFESYQRVLEIDANNVSAKLGIERVSQYYDTLARTKLTEGDRERALTIVSEGLESFPKHAGLLNIKESLEDQQDSILIKSDEAAFVEKQPEETKPKRKFRTSISF